LGNREKELKLDERNHAEKPLLDQLPGGPPFELQRSRVPHPFAASSRKGGRPQISTTQHCIAGSRLSASLILERGNVGIVPAQVSIKLPQVTFHRRQPRLDAIEPGIIQEDSNQDQYGWNRDGEGKLEIRRTRTSAQYSEI